MYHKKVTISMTEPQHLKMRAIANSKKTTLSKLIVNEILNNNQYEK
jgi:hypothetical protein